MKKSILLSALLASTFTFAQDSEDFESLDDNPLPGWLVSNQSNPAPDEGDRTWGLSRTDDPKNPSLFPAHSGVRFASANFQATGGPTTADGVLCNYLLTPPGIGGTLTFWTRSQRSVNDNITVFPDRMHVRYSLVEAPEGANIGFGNCTDDFGDFTEQLVIVNPLQSANNWPQGYPVDDWVEFTATIPAGTGRVAFIHYVTDAGTLGENSNRISLDDVTWTEGGPVTGETPIFINGFEAP